MGRKRCYATLALLLIPTLCYGAFTTDNLTISGQKSQTSLATDSNGKVIGGSGSSFNYSNYFNQSLNNTDSPSFVYEYLYNNLTIGDTAYSYDWSIVRKGANNNLEFYARAGAEYGKVAEFGGGTGKEFISQGAIKSVGNVTYTYNSDGTLNTKTTNSHTETYSYNGDGTLANKTDGIYLWNYTYTNGNLTAKTVTGG